MSNFLPTVLYTAAACIGAKEGTSRHKTIVDIYNMYETEDKRPYKISLNDPWCAAFVSAVFIASGCPQLIPIECSCFYIKNMAAKRGMLRDKTRYLPKEGDLILYKWAGHKVVSHIGIIESIRGSKLSVIEGNYKDSVARRNIRLSYQYIDSYIEVNYNV